MVNIITRGFHVDTYFTAFTSRFTINNIYTICIRWTHNHLLKKKKSNNYFNLICRKNLT